MNEDKDTKGNGKVKHVHRMKTPFGGNVHYTEAEYQQVLAVMRGECELPITAENRLHSSPEANRIDLQTRRDLPLHPECIVENYLYADLALLAAPGGTGKTTVVLWEMAHIVLGRRLWGLDVRSPGPCLLVTAEDSKEMCEARLMAIADAMELSEEERWALSTHLYIEDASQDDWRFVGPEGEVTDLPKMIAIKYEQCLVPLKMVVVDPVVSFVREETNAGLQPMVIACRMLSRRLKCCVRMVHHVGQESARSQASDQYVSRGGTALPDGCRMVATLIRPRPTDVPPYGWKTGEGIKLSRAKLSFVQAQPKIWLRRDGFAFEHEMALEQSNDEVESAQDAQMLNLIRSGNSNGRYPSKRSLGLELKPRNLTQVQARSAVERLLFEGRVVEVNLSKEGKKGGAGTGLMVAKEWR